MSTLAFDSFGKDIGKSLQDCIKKEDLMSVALLSQLKFSRSCLVYR